MFTTYKLKPQRTKILKPGRMPRRKPAGSPGSCSTRPTPVASAAAGWRNWSAELTGCKPDPPVRSARRPAGTVVVPLDKIVGSEGRSEDFDRAFNPLKKHNRERWISVAAARWTGAVLPAVELVQAGEEYYVRDGHHRISVAKVMGQLEIDARIMNSSESPLIQG